MGHCRWLLIILPVLLGGCSSQEVMLKKQAELEARLEQVVQAQSLTNARLTELSGVVLDVQAKLKTQALEVEQLKPGYRELKISLESTSQKLEKLASEAAAKAVRTEPAVAPELPAKVVGEQDAGEKPEPALSVMKPLGEPAALAAAGSTAPAASGPAPAMDPQAAYEKAFRLYTADRYTEALAAFEAFLAANPAHAHAPNAQYWIGECLYSLNNFEWSLDAFNKVVKSYPKSSKVPDAMLKGAFALFNMGQGDKAREMLHRLVATYPRSIAAGKAKERLDRERRK